MAKESMLSMIFGRQDEQDRGSSLLALLGFAAATAIAGAIGSVFSPDRRPYRRFYRKLDRPAWAPSDKAYPVAMSAAYGLSAISAWRVYRADKSPERDQALGLWFAQLGTSAIWPALFFGLESPKLALADAKLHTAAVAAYTAKASKVDKLAAILAVPHLAWSSFGTALNAAIVLKNWEK